MSANREESLALLNETHDFPTFMMFKIIGKNVDGFSGRVVACVRETLQLESDPHFRSRTTSGERHISITVEPEVPTAEMVLEIYDQLRQVDGVVMLL